MVMEVISYGNAQMLTTVLNGVAMLTDVGGSYNVYGLAKVGFLIGLLVTAFVGLAQRFEPQKIMLGYVFLAVMLIPKETVSVYDVYTGESETVSGVPEGAAMPMYVITQTGRWMTEAFETIYSVPSVKYENGGYLSTLRILLGMHHAMPTTSRAVIQSTRNYIHDCVTYAIADDGGLAGSSDRPQISTESIKAAPNMFEAMKTTYVNRFTVLFTETADPTVGTEMSCANAWERLSQAHEALALDWKKELKGQLRLTSDSENPSEAIERALEAFDLMKDTAVNGQVFIQNAFIGNLWLCETTNECAVLTGAGEKRRAEWAVEQSSFMQIARPIYAFIEMLVPAVIPLVAFFAGLGPAGASFIVKYLLLLCWVSLWQPFMALANMYIVSALTSDLAAASAPGIDSASFMGMESRWTTIADWIAVGGMLAASAPAIAGMLVWGVSASAGGLMSRAGGGGGNDVGPISPRVMDNGAVMSNGAAMTNVGGINRSANTGEMVLAGTQPGAGGSINVGSSTAAQVTSAAQQSLQQSSRESELAGIQAASTYGSTAAKAASNYVRHDSSASRAQTSQFAQETGNRLAKTHGWNSNEQTAFQMGLDATLSAGMKAGWSPKQMGAAISSLFSGSVGAKSGGDARVSSMESQGIADSFDSSVRNGSISSSEFRSSDGTGWARVKSQTDSDGHVVGANQSWSASKERMEQASRLYGEALQNQQMMSRDENGSVASLAGAVYRAGDEHVGAVVDAARNHGVSLDKSSRELRNLGFVAPSTAAAAIYGLANGGQEAQRALANVLQSAGIFHGGMPSTTSISSSDQNKGLVSSNVGLTSPQAGAIRGTTTTAATAATAAAPKSPIQLPRQEVGAGRSAVLGGAASDAETRNGVPPSKLTSGGSNESHPAHVSRLDASHSAPVSPSHGHQNHSASADAKGGHSGAAGGQRPEQQGGVPAQLQPTVASNAAWLDGQRGGTTQTQMPRVGPQAAAQVLGATSSAQTQEAGNNMLMHANPATLGRVGQRAWEQIKFAGNDPEGLKQLAQGLGALALVEGATTLAASAAARGMQAAVDGIKGGASAGAAAQGASAAGSGAAAASNAAQAEASAARAVSKATSEVAGKTVMSASERAVSRTMMQRVAGVLGSEGFGAWASGAGRATVSRIMATAGVRQAAALASGTGELSLGIVNAAMIGWSGYELYNAYQNFKTGQQQGGPSQAPVPRMTGSGDGLVMQPLT